MRSTNQHLRALPFRPPMPPVAPEANLRRWTLGLVAVGAGVFVLLVAGVVFAIQRSRPPVDSTRPEPTLAPVVESPVEPKPAPRVETAATPAPTDAVQQKYLEALGGLSAAHLYQSYLNIGLIADAVESDSTSRDDGRKLLDTVDKLMMLMEKQLTIVEPARLDEDDRTALEQIKAVTGLLRLQRRSLLAYWDTGDPARAEEYQRARTAAWTGLSRVLSDDDPNETSRDP